MTNEKFQQAYQKLNPAQKEAVDSIEGPVMVIAGPGTGKTQILTLRIANILQNTDTPANGILALTFTEAGQKAMKLRLRDLIGVRADEVGIYTYHGFAASVIAEFQDHFPHLARTKQLNDIEIEALIRGILKSPAFSKLRPLGKPDLYVGSIIKSISEAKKEAVRPEELRRFATEQIQAIKSDEASISTRGATKGQLKAEALKRIEKGERTLLLADIYELYELKKLEEHKLDFDDLIFELVKALETDELLLRLIQEKYLYLLVDEHQDTNNSQNLLIRKIADFYEEPNLFVVGDEKQAIYRFQGASVQNFLQFQHLWPKMKLISLVDNYRSHQGILDASFQMIENNYQETEHHNLRIKLQAAKQDEPRPLDLVEAANNLAADKYLVEAITQIVETDETATIAVITRKNKEVEKVLTLLETAGIRATAERGADIFSHPIGVIYFDLLAALSDPANVEALAKTLATGLWHLSFADAVTLIKQVRSGDVSHLEEKIPAWLNLKHKISQAGALEFLILAGQESGLTELATRRPLAAEVWRSIMTLAGYLAEEKMVTDARTLIKELLDYRQSAESRSVKIMAGSSDARVRVMTAHGAKGLEYDYVFLPYATEEVWMSGRKGTYFLLPGAEEEGDEIRDSRRLFYVALTRARQHAAIIYGLSDDLGKSLTPLRFIDELDSTALSRLSLPAVTRELLVRPSGALAGTEPTEFLDYAKNVLLEKGLSVTALNHYCECPNKFFYQSILKLPEAPSPSAEKGNAMHEAMALAWSLPAKNEAAVATALNKAVQSYFSHSLLPLFEKEAVLKELAEEIPLVAKALLPHFSAEGTIATEKWVETNFIGTFAGQVINLRLHGKLDALRETARQLAVYDYKTKAGMSLKEIKGETQNSDGGYFRQLVFYKLLLINNSIYQNKEIAPALVFIKPDDKGRCPIVGTEIETADLEWVKQEIQALIDDVWSGEIFSKTCDDPQCSYCRLRGLLN